jgi:hypothetical protein
MPIRIILCHVVQHKIVDSATTSGILSNGETLNSGG